MVKVVMSGPFEQGRAGELKGEAEIGSRADIDFTPMVFYPLVPAKIGDTNCRSAIRRGVVAYNNLKICKALRK
jgi:hypothetical protein